MVPASLQINHIRYSVRPDSEMKKEKAGMLSWVKERAMLMGEVQEGCLENDFLQHRMEGCTEIGHTFCTNEIFESRLSPDIKLSGEVPFVSCA